MVGEPSAIWGCRNCRNCRKSCKPTPFCTFCSIAGRREAQPNNRPGWLEFPLGCQAMKLLAEVTPARPKPALSLPPRGISRVEAAAYVGVSPSKFDEMVRDHRMPNPKRIDC